MRKEYNDRWNAPLVNPGITAEEYERQRQPKVVQVVFKGEQGYYFYINDKPICYSTDRELVRKVARALTSKGATVIFYNTGWPLAA